MKDHTHRIPARECATCQARSREAAKRTARKPRSPDAGPPRRTSASRVNESAS
jgi:hypothetical protein